MTQKLIVLMVDGISADQYINYRENLPHLMQLEKRGFRIERLHSEQLGVSLSGRVGMLTGHTADQSGVYGNQMWDKAEKRFRYANPDDIRVPTMMARAQAKGRKTACIGAGMIRPEDCDLMMPPNWVDGWAINRARDPEPVSADHPWQRVVDTKPTQLFYDQCTKFKLPTDYPAQMEGFYEPWMLLCDQLICDWVSAVAAAEESPDLIWAEFCIPDHVLHGTGIDSDWSNWVLAEADMAVGKIMQRLEDEGVADQWNIAVMGDHGFGPIETTIHLENIVPDIEYSGEGAVAVVHADAAKFAEILAAVAPLSVEEGPKTMFPEDVRGELHLLIAPDKHSFEGVYGRDRTEPTGAPGAIATHGFRPGSPLDDRMCIMAGPRVPSGSLESADANQVAPSLAKIMGLETDSFPADAIF
ncbi:MAG: alkaline phosphatase family protein [Chloroflexota bacterium]